MFKPFPSIIKLNDDLEAFKAVKIQNENFQKYKSLNHLIV